MAPSTFNKTEEFDLVIYGSTPAAISAALQAKRMGKRAVVVSPETRIGGLTTGGLGQTDIGNKSAFGGIALEFYRAVAAYYRDEAAWTWQKRSDYLPGGQCEGTKGEDSMWTFEPSAALKILESWEKANGLEIHRGKRLDRSKGKVKTGGEGRRIISFFTEDGTEYCGKMFIDATYEGDLMAAAGVSYTVGREPNAQYGETISGVQHANARYHQFVSGIDPYVVKGDPKSGLLPGVEPYDPNEKDGDGDRRVQAYCFRMCLTDVPENRIPFAKPANYDERNYELLLRNVEAFDIRPEANPDWSIVGLPWINSKMPNRKTDTNNRLGVSTDFIGQNWAWPEASYAEREKMLREHLDWQRGLVWTLAYHPRVPEFIREEVSRWGTCKDEFADGLGDGWQTQLYVREARRLVGDTVMTEHHCRGKAVAHRPVAMAAYTMDSHNVRRCVNAEGFVRNEGDVEIHGGSPYGIDYGAIIPKRGECANLFVPVCLSASHMAFGSIRMEPVFFALGQAAATAAVQAIDAACAVQDLPYAPLAGRLRADGQVLPRISMDPLVPFDETRTSGLDETETELRKINAETGLRRFFITAPGFGGVMYGPFADDLYDGIGRDIAELKHRLSDTDIDIYWWCSPSIRYFSDFPSIEDPEGHRSVDNKKCPLDPAFAADWAAKVKSVAQTARPKMISIEDDYTLSWGRGLNRHGACFCERHLALFAKIYGKALTAPEIAAAFENRTPENLAIRRAFADTVRESLVSLAKTVRAAVDEVDPSIRITLCESGDASDKDGDALEAIVRAFAGKTRPAVRPSGAIYGAETTPADIPVAVAHTMFTLERLPADVETFYEADPYPHNRFYTSAAQMASLMTGAMVMGSDDIYFYCLQYLDDPFEDPGYARAYLALKPRLEAVRDFIRRRKARLAGVRNVWTADDRALVRGFGYAHGGQLQCGAYLLSKFGIPYTTRRDAKGPSILAGGVVEVLSDDELKAILSGGVLVDAVAAELIAGRGFGDLLGTGVEPIEGRPRVTGETILPAAGCARPGKKVNAFYIFFAGTEGTVERFATLRPHPGTEVWSEFTDPDGKLVTPSLTFATNALGGRVAVMATSLLGNRSSGLYNLRKQELFQNLFRRMTPGAIPVEVVGAPGIWTLAQVAENGDAMLVMLNNLSGDVRDDVTLAFANAWAGAKIARLGADGNPEHLGETAERWNVPFALGQMEPEFLVVER